MSHEKVSPLHLMLRAIVYLRQSSAGQVKNNVEGKERQRKMVERPVELGWSHDQVSLLGNDTGNSGSSLHGRDDYQRMFEAVMAGEVGIICALELSRLVRENQDWIQLVRICRYKGVLLADAHRVYEPSDAQDRIVLGIQGAFNEFELAMICERMIEARIQKAGRGELYEALPPGYICRCHPLYEKHPDERVQRAIQKVFDEFERGPSCLSMYDRLIEEGFKLPVVPHGRDWRDVEWVRPRYQRLLAMLKNPAYAGIYAWGRTRTFTELDEDGHAVKKRQRVPRDEWEFFIEGHHAPYIDKATWEKNEQKVAANANMNGNMNKRSPQNGKSVLAGLLRCRRCGHRLHAAYSSGKVRYTCRGGARQRLSPSKTCFAFTATRIEEQFIHQLLDVLSPAGIEAAREAARQLAQRHSQRRQLLLDRLEECQEKEARAAREYKSTDATYTSVRRKLGEEWNEAIRAVEAQQTRLETFDKEQPGLPTVEQQSQLDTLGEELERLWYHPKASGSLKKRVVGTLVEEIIVDVDEQEDEVILLIHWAGGHHTELREPRRRRKPRSSPGDLKATMDTLRKVLPDAAIACVLNREKILTDKGETWTARKVQNFRKTHDIEIFSQSRKDKERWLTQAEAATTLKISPMSVTRLVQEGILPADQPNSGLPAVIQAKDLNLSEVEKAVKGIKLPLPQHPDQLNLFDTTNS